MNGSDIETAMQRMHAPKCCKYTDLQGLKWGCGTDEVVTVHSSAVAASLTSIHTDVNDMNLKACKHGPMLLSGKG